MTTCNRSHADPDDIPAFLCRRCNPELAEPDLTPLKTTTAQESSEPSTPRDRYGRQLARGIEPDTLAELLAEQDKEIAAKKVSDESRFKELRAEAADLKAAGIKVPRRVKRK